MRTTESHEVLWWNGLKGVASLSYPHPKNWTFAQVQNGTPLHKLKVKDLTLAINEDAIAINKCMENWRRPTSSWRIRAHIDWEAYGQTYCSRLTTNKDVWSHFKYILNRKLVLRSFCPSSTGNHRCRCCGRARETHTHMLRCHVLWEVWKPLRRLASEIWKRVHVGVEFVYLGVAANGEIMPGGLMALHRIMWKMTIIALTKVEFENENVNPLHIWSMTCRRYIVRCRALFTAHAWARHTAITFGRNPPKPSTINKWMNPVAHCDENCRLIWHKKWVDLCKNYNIILKQEETLHTHRNDRDVGQGAQPPRTPSAPPTHQNIRACYTRSFVKPKPKRRISDDE